MTGSAKQSSFGVADRKLDCFVAPLLAMTARQESTFSRREPPEAFINIRPDKGVGNAGRAMHPQPRVQK
jgi:hypothetical protein